MAPYRQGQVSLPDSCAAVRELETLCSEAGLQYLEGCGERMFQAGVEPLADERELRYVDPTLTKNRKSYIRFIKDLKRRGLLVFDTDVTETCGIFFVCKKNGQLRMIIDARRANRRLRPPPGVSMVSAEGLGRIEIETDNPSEPVPIWVGTADVKDCFHRMGIPRWMSKLFGMPRCRHGSLGSQRSTAGALVRTTGCTPCPAACPWAVRGPCSMRRT